MFSRNASVIILIFAACAVCYFASLMSGFVWDDEFLVVNNPLVRAPLLSLSLFTNDIVNSNFIYTIYYRPLQVLSYAIDYRLGGLSPVIFHLTGLLLHFTNSALIYILTLKLTGKRDASGLTALFFAVHPAFAGAVAYISGRADLLYVFFGLLYFLSFIYFREKEKGSCLALSTVFLVLALLSKEAALILPLLLVLVDLVFLKDKPFRIRYHLPAFAVFGAYLALHAFFFGDRYGMILSGGFGERLLSYIRMAGEFLALTAFPAGLYMRRGMALSGSELAVIAAFLAVGAGLFIFSKESRRITGFAFMFFLTALVPMLFVTGHFGVFAEHWVYLASYGVFLILAQALSLMTSSRKAFIRGAGALFAVMLMFYYAFKAFAQAAYWEDSIKLSDRVLEAEGTDSAAAFFKSAFLVKDERGKGGSGILDEYVEANPDDLRTLYIRGRINLAAGRTDKAVSDFTRAMEQNSAYDNAYFGMALVSFMKGDTSRGIKYLEKTIRLNPRHAEALYILSTAYSKEGDDEKALRTAKRAKDLNPYDYNAIVNLGTAYSRAQDPQRAALLYLEATRLYPEKPLAHYNLGYILYMGGQAQEAEKYLKRALELDPGFRPAAELLERIEK